MVAFVLKVASVAALLLVCLPGAFAASDDDPLADSRKLTRRVQALLDGASRDAYAGEASDNANEAILTSKYDDVLKAFEDGSHPLLQDHEDLSEGVNEREEMEEDRLAAALKAERKRRRRAEAALDAALERARKAEKRYAVLLRSAPKSLSKSKSAKRSRIRKL